jgi:hypothetical protein
MFVTWISCYVVGSKSFRPDQLFKVKQLCWFSIQSPFILTHFSHLWTSNSVPLKKYYISLVAFSICCSFCMSGRKLTDLTFIYNVRYYLWFHITTFHLRMCYLQIGDTTVIVDFSYVFLKVARRASCDISIIRSWRVCRKLGLWNENQKVFNPNRFLMIRVAAWVTGFTIWHILKITVSRSFEAMLPVPGT